MPGFTRVNSGHRAAINKAAEYYTLHQSDHPGVDADLDFSRLLWLQYWAGWAIDNCELPILWTG
mgnify:CR=1 FL=1